MITMLPVPASHKTPPFMLDCTPVTVGQYRAYAPDYAPQFDGPDLPATEVSWYDAVRYCNARSLAEGLTPAYLVSDGNEPTVERIPGATGYYLPTESEWEWAARGPNGRTYPWGEEPPTAKRLCWGRAWAQGPDPVGSHPDGAGPSGHLDLAGLAWEWCEDLWAPGDAARVVRGGGWFLSFPSGVRGANRDRGAPADRNSNVGFRCARAGDPRPSTLYPSTGSRAVATIEERLSALESRATFRPSAAELPQDEAAAKALRMLVWTLTTTGEDIQSIARDQVMEAVRLLSPATHAFLCQRLGPMTFDMLYPGEPFPRIER